ncbi:sugar phosphate isomerase/epimerase family protein [Paenibacillus eucommiae]|uniref:Sugar phosphate isomerase/epimerase n=1 Tax=Paenibacillus eucommiae TaxID=1355755 RepID=A0ABS4J833_9BACL|nr:TIM barrel protein [Paenibacillus eucommiae]MBP1995970.1 sugar phosphate isomerase/epimerase [Paenibacillus eucommiae]
MQTGNDSVQGAWNRYKNGSKEAPKLDIQQSWWAMYGLGDGTSEWSMEEKFEQIAKAGFTGILGRLPAPAEAEQWRKLLDEYGFSFGIQSFPESREDLGLLMRQAKDFGVQYVNSQVADSFLIGAAAIQLLRELNEEACSAQIPYFIETHRGKVTQDLLRTVDYIQAVGDLRLTIDFSHYVLAGEMNEAAVKAEPFFEKLLQRTSAIHARVSNGQQIQVDIGAAGEHPMVPYFMRWWKRGMAYWLQRAQPGEVLPFVVELGPPAYSMICEAGSRQERGFRTDHREISDRWQQALVFKQLAEEAWKGTHVR